VTRGKFSLYFAWACVAGAVATAGRYELVAGALFVLAALALSLAVACGVVTEYSGRDQSERLPRNRVRIVSAVAVAVAICFAVLGVSLIGEG
jgi:hypothetical protein